MRPPDWGSAGESATLPPSRIGGGMSAAAVRTGRTMGDAGVTPSSQSFWSLMVAIVVWHASTAPALTVPGASANV